MKKLTDIEFEALENQLLMIDEQIKILQESKKEVLKLFGITKQSFYSRIVRRDKRSKLEVVEVGG